MDRKERMMVLEPLLLILKSRKGVATVIGILLSVVLYLMGFPDDIVQMIVVLVFVYVGGQAWVDSREASTSIIEFVDDFKEPLEQVKEKVNSDV